MYLREINAGQKILLQMHNRTETLEYTLELD
jgi:hypothetical protein